MLIEKADMLDALLERFNRMDLLVEAKKDNGIALGYVAGWFDTIGSLVDAEEKKQDERKELLETFKKRCAAKGCIVPPDEEIAADMEIMAGDEYSDVDGGDDRATD